MLQTVKLTGLFRITEASLVEVASTSLDSLCLLNCKRIQRNNVYIDRLRRANCLVTHITIEIPSPQP